MHSGKRDLPYTNSHFPAKLSRVSFSLLRCSKLRWKNWPQKDKRKPLSPSSRGGIRQQAPRTPQLKHCIFRKQFWMWSSLQFCCNDGSEPNTPSWTLQAVAQRAFSTPTTRCSQWCSQLRQIGEPGLDTPTTGSTLFLFFLSPGNFLSSKTVELTVLLQQTTKLHSLKASQIYRRPVQTSSWDCNQQEQPRFTTTHQREERQGRLHLPYLSFDLFLIISPDAWRVIQQRADQRRWLLRIRAQVWR